MKTGKIIRQSVLKYAGLIVIFGLLSSLLMGFYSFKLFSNLRTELEELLPTDSRSVLDLSSIQSRLESTNNLEIVIISSNKIASKKLVDDLALQLEKVPKSIVSSVEYKIDTILQFFQSRRALFIDNEDLLKIKNYIKAKVHYESQLYNPLTFLENLSLKEPKLNFDLFQRKYSSRTDNYTHFPGGYYASADERIRVVVVNLPANAGGISSAKRLRATVDSIILGLNPKNYSSDLEIHFTGGVQDLLEEHEALIEDLTLSTIVVCLLVGLAMLIYFKSVISTASLIFSLMVGVIWTFGLGFFEIGYLNANTAFMASIVIGNGINFGIILLARYIEERRKNKGVPRSLAIALKYTFPATLVAASAAALSYGSLILTSFRGFRQFGIIGLTGMLLCWCSTYALLPALMICFDRMGLIKLTKGKSKVNFSHFLSKFVEKYSKTILVFTVLFTIFSISMLPRINSTLIESDLKKIRNRKSLVNGSMYWSKYVDEVFKHYLSPLVILPKSFDHVIPIQVQLKKIQTQEGANSFITSVSTIHDFVPLDQKEKISILKEIDNILTPELRFKMEKNDRRLVNELLSKNSFRSFSSQDLPELVKSKFRERDGTMGKLVLVEPTLGESLSKSEALIHFVHTIRDTADKIEPGVPVAGSLPVTSDMFESIINDGPKTTLCAFIAVLVLIVILFRSPANILFCAFTLILGILWLIGMMLAMGIKINFLNFIALPITFGIGVDYGINIFQRYRMDQRSEILSVIENTGGAVILASMTTVIGYGSLIIASNQAFVSFGTLAILGEWCCVTAAVFSLPALLLNLKAERKIFYGISVSKKT